MKKIKIELKAGMTAYIMMMFGMTIICYMMGFTNLWTVWSSGSAASAQGLSSPGISDPGLFSSQFVIYGIIVAAMGTTILTGVVLKYLGGAQILAYLIPVVFLMVFLNLFIFPISTFNNELQFAGSYLPIGGFLIAFFNLFLILSIIEFIRSGTT